MTNEELLAKWDAGEPVWTCEMGGIGPGYEQCIQTMAFEFLRAMIAKPPESWDKLSGDDGRDAWTAYRDEIEAVPEVKAIVSKMGPSGAQFGAAMSLASRFAMRGYDKSEIPEDRKILVSKNFPSIAA